jgi:hypothetical protein
MTSIYHHVITEPSAWTVDDLSSDRSWDLTLQEEQVGDLLAALETVKEAGLDLSRLDSKAFPLPHCREVVEQIRHQLRDGRGFSLLHGFPVEGQDHSDIEIMYWGFCSHLGIGLTQNSDSTLIHYVTEGRLRPNQGTRGVGDPGKVSMHVDLADCVSLLCLRQPEDSPRSRLASSTTIHNLLLEKDPRLLERLYEGFEWDRQNEHDSRESPTTGYRVPVFSEKDGVVSCRYNRNWMTKAIERHGESFTRDDTALLDLFDELADANCFEFDFNPGDVQFANNYTILHGRAPHAPAQSEETSRVLMRIWLDLEGMRSWADEGKIRYGIIRHGRLGWTAKQFAEGIEGRLHDRRASDDAPLVA